MGEVPAIRRVNHGSGLIVPGKLGDGTLEEYFGIRPPTCFLADFSTLVGSDWYRHTSSKPLDHSAVRTFDEFGTTVDIERECANARTGTKTIHEFTEDQFLLSAADVVIYDHRTNEVADYISITETDDSVICELAHCKGASDKKTSKPKMAASRVDDAYEVARQVVKCLPYSKRPEELRGKLVSRIASGSVLKLGTVEIKSDAKTNRTATRHIRHHQRLC